MSIKDDPIFADLERQDRFYRDNPIADGEPPLSERERRELLLRELEREGILQ